MITKQLYNTAIYLRLSRDDEKFGDSISIETQRTILTQFASEQNLLEFLFPEKKVRLIAVTENDYYGHSRRKFHLNRSNQQLKKFKNGMIDFICGVRYNRITEGASENITKRRICYESRK